MAGRVIYLKPNPEGEGMLYWHRKTDTWLPWVEPKPRKRKRKDVNPDDILNMSPEQRANLHHKMKSGHIGWASEFDDDA